MSPVKRANIMSGVIACFGIILFWVGMIFAFELPRGFHLWGLIMAFVGLCVVIVAYPIRKVFLSRQVKKYIDGLLIKAAEENFTESNR